MTAIAWKSPRKAMPQASEAMSDRGIATPAPRSNDWTAGPYLTQGRLPLLRPVIRIDGWRPLEFEQIGSKPKRWFEGPDGSRWLFKPARENPRRGGESYRCGDDWAEVVAADVGRLLGLPTAQVELAVLDADEGVLSRNVVRRGAMIHGNELLAGRFEGYDGADGRGDANYTVRNAMETVAPMAGPPDSGLSGSSHLTGHPADRS